MKRYRVVVTAEAIGDLVDIHRYFSAEASPELADRLVDTLEKACSQLERMPSRGHLPPELERVSVLDYREIHSTHYRIIYEIAGSRVVVHAILDGRRDMDDLLHWRMLR